MTTKTRFVAELTAEEQEALDRIRASLGLRSKADVLRMWISNSPYAPLHTSPAPAWVVPTPPAPTLQPGTCHVRSPERNEMDRPGFANQDGKIVRSGHMAIPDVPAELINGLPNNTSGGVSVGRPTAKPGSLLKKGKGK